jgi:hypothetical protein
MNFKHYLQYINPHSWFLFIKSKLRKLFTPKNAMEFYKYLTIRSAICPDCVLNSKCSECGCATPDIFYEQKECNRYKKYKTKKV